MGVAEKVKAAPPLTVVNGNSDIDTDEVTLKSVLSPVVGPSPSETMTEQLIGELVREGLTFVHVRRDEVVGLPKTTKTGVPPLTGVEVLVEITVIEYAEVITTGATENENELPPSEVEIVIGEEGADETVKSELTPVVAPTESETLMVQITSTPRRHGFVFKHERVEVEVGLPNTTKEGEPALITALPIADLTLMV